MYCNIQVIKTRKGGNEGNWEMCSIWTFEVISSLVFWYVNYACGCWPPWAISSPQTNAKNLLATMNVNSYPWGADSQSPTTRWEAILCILEIASCSVWLRLCSWLMGRRWHGLTVGNKETLNLLNIHFKAVPLGHAPWSWTAYIVCILLCNLEIVAELPVTSLLWCIIASNKAWIKIDFLTPSLQNSVV